MLKKFLIEQPADYRFLKISDGPSIQWRESFIADEKIISFYLAKNERVLREEAKKFGVPLERVIEINEVIDTSDTYETDRSGVEKL